MRIRIVQSGGLAGLRRERVVETERLPAGAREAIEALVGSSSFFALPERLVSKLPDVTLYRVTIEQAGLAHEVTFDDETATEPLRALVTRAFEERTS